MTICQCQEYEVHKFKLEIGLLKFQSTAFQWRGFMSCRLEFNENWQAHQQNWSIQYENEFISDANKATEVIKLRTMSDKYSISWEVSVPVKGEAEGSTELRQYISFLQLTPDKHTNLVYTFRQRCTISLSKRDKFKGLWPKYRRKVQAHDISGRAV
jgi:hypothetical protein